MARSCKHTFRPSCESLEGLVLLAPLPSGPDGLGVHLPSDAGVIVEDCARLGASYAEVPKFGVQEPGGGTHKVPAAVLVDPPSSDSPLRSLGLTTNDTITKLDGVSFSSPSVCNQVDALVGQTAITYIRSSQGEYFERTGTINLGPSEGQTGSALTPAEANELVQYHNTARAQVGVGPVEWSPTVAKFAQEWADEVARTGNVAHRPAGGQRYGENIAWGSGNFGVMPAAKLWYDEKQFYTPGTPIPQDFASFKAGHYTQMVWKNTTEIGAGKAVIQTGPLKGWLVVVCNYNPPGNFIGQKPY